MIDVDSDAEFAQMLQVVHSVYKGTLVKTVTHVRKAMSCVMILVCPPLPSVEMESSTKIKLARMEIKPMETVAQQAAKSKEDLCVQECQALAHNFLYWKTQK